MNKIEKVFKFYVLATELKDTIRKGWKDWNISRNRIESVAEHIYGTCILAIAIDSEYELDIDIKKVVLMLVIHELEEVYIGDITPFDRITCEEKRVKGKEAVEKILDGMLKKEEYVNLTEEFNNMLTKEAKFAKVCDKLECDIQCKLYCEEDSLQLNKKENEQWLKDKRIEELLNHGSKSIADLFIEKDMLLFEQNNFKEIANFVKDNNLLKLKE